MREEALKGIRVVDFSTLLPGPLATLYLSQAGAEVIKIERPEKGDPIRGYLTQGGAVTVHHQQCRSFHKLNPDRMLSVRWTAGLSKDKETQVQ